MNRQEHLQWCKDRAIKEVDNGDLNSAFASLTSDMGKHIETANHIALEMGNQLFFSGGLSTPDRMRNWILGFN